MDAEILDRPPLSGEFEEHDFSTSGGTLWIKFLDKEYLEWIGVFSQGEWNSNNKVFEVPDKGEFLVVAGGQGYFVDPNTRKITGKTEWDNIEDIVYNEETGLFVVTDGLSLALLEDHKQLWSSERISADGIQFLSQKGSTVKGKLNDLTSEGCEFTFDIESKNVKSSWVLRENWGY